MSKTKPDQLTLFSVLNFNEILTLQSKTPVIKNAGVLLYQNQSLFIPPDSRFIIVSTLTRHCFIIAISV